MRRTERGFDPPHPCKEEFLRVLLLSIPAMLVRLAVSPSYRKFYREQKRQHLNRRHG